mgnify:CR=1 FL=1
MIMSHLQQALLQVIYLLHHYFLLYYILLHVLRNIYMYLMFLSCFFGLDAHRGHAYEDDDVEASTYVLHGTYDDGLPSKSSHKKKHLMQQRMNGTRHYSTGVDMPYDPYVESKPGNQPFLSNGKRPSDFFNIPTKRIRTAARQRVVSPYPANASGATAFTSKTDASSGDTNSCQDDQSSLHGGSFPRKNVDIESTVDFDRQLYDGSEVSTKSKKKKKSKHPGYKTPQSVAESCSLIAGKVKIFMSTLSLSCLQCCRVS